MSPFRALALLVLAVPAFAGEPRIAVLDVPGMNCSLCPISVRKALTRAPGVIDASAELASKRAVVHYDPDKITPEQLAAAVTNAGFPATVHSK
jgi:mercuric ion binding protein